MVFKFDEAEFHWKWRWFFRPNQRIGMTVEDYYAQFREWKEEMVSLSFSAEEGDYIDGFIENLRWDIRLRLSKRSSSSSRLINAFYDAKFEESMMSIEEALKKIQAHILFDEMPSRVLADKFEVTDSAFNVFDEMVEPNPTNLQLTDEYYETAFDKNFEQNEAGYVLAEVPEPFPEDENDGREETIAEQVVNGSENSAHYVFDNLAKPFPTSFPSFSPIQPIPAKPSLEQTEEKDEDDPVGIVLHECELLGNEMGHPPLSKMRSLEAVRKMFVEMSCPISIKHDNENDNHEGLVLLTTDLSTILGYGEAAPEFHSLKQDGLADTRHSFDEMPRLISVELNGGIYDIQDYIAHFGYVLQNFETGSSYLLDDGVILAFDPGGNYWFHNGKNILTKLSIQGLFVEMEKHEMSNSHLLLHFKPDIEFCNSKVTMFVFDPGGSYLFYKGRDPFDFRREEQEFDKFLEISFASDLDVKNLLNIIRGYQYKPILPSAAQDFCLWVGEHNVGPDCGIDEKGKDFAKLMMKFVQTPLQFVHVERMVVLGLMVMDKTIWPAAKQLHGISRGWCIFYNVAGSIEMTGILKDEGNGHVAACKIKNPTMMGLGMSRRVIVIEPNLMVCRLILKWVDQACSWRLFGDFLIRLGTISILLQNVHHTGNELRVPKEMKLVLKLSTILYTTVYATTNSGFLLLVDYILGATLAIFGAIIGVSHNTSFDDIVVRYGKAQELTSKLLIFLLPPWNLHTIDRTELYGCWVIFCWGQFSTVLLAWYTQIAEYIAWEVKKEAQHYTNATMDTSILLKHLVNREQERICVVKLLDHLKHKDILLIFMTEPSKVPMKSGVFMLLLYFAVAMMIFVLAILTDFVWDPGLVWVSHFTTLRTRRLLRGRICHVPRLKIRKITEESVGDVRYELLAVNDVIVISSLYLCRISVI